MSIEKADKLIPLADALFEHAPNALFYFLFLEGREGVISNPNSSLNPVVSQTKLTLTVVPTTPEPRDTLFGFTVTAVNGVGTPISETVNLQVFDPVAKNWIFAAQILVQNGTSPNFGFTGTNIVALVAGGPGTYSLRASDTRGSSNEVQVTIT